EASQRQNEAERQRLRTEQEERERHSAAERQRLLTEQGMDHALKQASKIRGELVEELRRAGGVQRLLNQKARWQALLQSGQAELTLARTLAARAASPLDAAWSKRIAQMQQELDGDVRDFNLAVRLEKIRLDRAVWHEGKFNYAQAEQEY